jgi:hypothetical protein
VHPFFSAQGEPRHPVIASGDSEPQLSGVAAFLLPSIGDLIFLVLFFSLTYGALGRALLGDADIGWHIRNGENILSTRMVPHVDSFSASMAGKSWVAWEWLYDAAIALIHNAAGLNGVVAFSAFAIALTFALVFQLSLKKGASLGMTLVFLVLCILASSIHFLARPHVVGWLLTVVWFWMLEGSHRSTLAEGRADPTPILLPLLMIAWVNLHGSFVMGFLLLGIYFLADVLTAYMTSNEQLRANALVHARLMGAVSVMSALTSLLNPFGYKLHVHVYQYLSSPFLMRHIEEFRSPDFRHLPAQSFLLLLALTAIGIVLAKAQLSWTEWLVTAFCVCTGFWAARNLPTSSMLLTIVFAPLLSRARQGKTFRGWPRFALSQQRLRRIETHLRGHLWPLVLIVVTSAVCLNHGKVFGRQVLDAHFNAERFPVHAVDFLIEHGNREPIFSLDWYGGYLIYRLHPNVKVFIDDRHDFYGEAYLTKYLKVLHVEPGWQTVLDEAHANVVLVPTKSRISDALGQNAEWKTQFSDATATIFQRSSR